MGCDPSFCCITYSVFSIAALLQAYHGGMLPDYDAYCWMKKAICDQRQEHFYDIQGSSLLDY